MTTPWWHTRTWRLIQTNLREIDMLDIRAAQVIADLQAFKANVLMINAAGIIASYPTKLPYQFQSPYLTGDSLQDILKACHAAGIRVIARTDFSKVRLPIYAQHPEWASITSQGNIIEYNGDVQACLNGGYQQEYMFQIIAELLSSHPFDGIFFNMGGYQTRDYSGNYHGLCHCQACQHKFYAMFALPLPVKDEPSDPVFRKYEAFKQLTMKQHRQRVVSFIYERWPELAIADPGEQVEGFYRMESNTALDRPLPHWQYSGSDNTKWITSSFPKLVSSNTTVDFIDFPYRHVAVSPHQQALRLVQALANGGALDYYLIGRLDNHLDRSGFEGIKEIFHYHAAHEATYANLRSKAGIALVKEVNGWNATDEYRGWFRTLAENHFLFDAPGLEALTHLDWSKYRAVILPDVKAISAEMAARLDIFVSEGGRLVVAGQCLIEDDEAGLGENLGSPTGTGSLAGCFALNSAGIKSIRQSNENTRSTYLKLDDKTGFRRFTDTDLIFVDGAYFQADFESDVQLRFKIIPPHPFGPPERCYFTHVTNLPGFTVRKFGLGKTIFVPWLPGTLFHRQGYLNTCNFMADLLEGEAGLVPVGGNLPPVVEVTLHEKENGTHCLIHLVNASGHFGASFYEPLPIHDVVVSLRLEREPQAVKALVGGQCSYDWHAGILTVRLSRLGMFEALEIDYRIPENG